ncbi:MAG TPA: hypothetical protein VFA89_02065 [Terriglobales bacterium]|nr:hypothetical protein [Terriglobales bacterium]
MITFTVLILAAVLLVMLGLLSRRRAFPSHVLDELALKTRSVDIEAFRNLVDPEEEHYLRRQLSSREFRSVHRERMLAATEYVRAASYNAKVLMRLGEATRHHTDPEIARAGQELVNSATQLQLYSLLVLGKLWAAICLPDATLSLGAMADRYERVSGLAARVGRMQDPVGAARLVATL